MSRLPFPSAGQEQCRKKQALSKTPLPRHLPVSPLVPSCYPHRLSQAPCLSGAPSGKAGCDPPSPGRLSPIPGGLQVPTGNLRAHLLSPGELNRGTFSQSHASYSSTLISFRILSSEINVFKFNKIAPCHCYGLEASQCLLVL